MIDLTGVTHNRYVEEITQLLCNRTQNLDTSFYRVEAAFFLTKMASSMRATVRTKHRGDIPVNMYAIMLATSGYGKGHSISIVENELINGFKKQFAEDVLPKAIEENLNKLATDRAVKNGTEPEAEFESLVKEYNVGGEFIFTFDSGTVPAIKQYRHNLLLSMCGALSLQIDEIGNNLINNAEILTLFLELFDLGIAKQKLIKNTAENKRVKEIDGRSPANMLLFGTPSALLDGGQVEEQFQAFLGTGYGRRCFFAHGIQRKSQDDRTPAEIFDKLIQKGNSTAVKNLSADFQALANPAYLDWTMIMDDTVAVKLIEYQLNCEKAAEKLPEHAEIRKAELMHRYFKAMKLAGTFAFCDRSPEIEMDHLLQAILLTEESGKAFEAIMNREKPYEKLAKFLAAEPREVTHTDLMEALPFYGRSNAARTEMMNLAIAWGYRNNIIIKRTFVDTVEFFKAETLKETDLDALMVSISTHQAYNYEAFLVPFDQLDQLVQAPDYHWTTHAFQGEHRLEDKVIPGFNMVVLDVDEGTTVDMAHELLKDYVHAIYTTKRHTEDHHRFRVILPMNFHLELDKDEYKEFMASIVGWLPFKVDEAANQRSRKWLSHDGGRFIKHNAGELLDARDFIPRTSRNETRAQQQLSLSSMDNLERWIASRMVPGDRNNQMLRYAMILVDAGMTLEEVRSKVLTFNKSIKPPLDEDEITNTIMKSVANKYPV